MKKKEIKNLLSRFDEFKMPDKHKIISSCGTEYRYIPRESEQYRHSRALSPLMLVVIIIMIIASIVTVSANLEGAQGFMKYIEYHIRVFYGNGSYSDKVVSGYVPGASVNGTAQTGAHTGANTQTGPNGIVQNPDYWDKHQKDVSGYTAEVKYVQVGGERIVVHINGGEDFKVYKNYVKIERRSKTESGAKWENIFERLLPSYEIESGNVVLPTTGVYSGKGDFVAEIEGLARLLESDGAEYEYRITVKVCSPKGAPDEGNVSAKFEPKDFQ
jgi:hypothetical protein